MKKGVSKSEDLERIKILQRLLQPKLREGASATTEPKSETPPPEKPKTSIAEILKKTSEKQDQSQSPSKKSSTPVADLLEKNSKPPDEKSATLRVAAGNFGKIFEEHFERFLAQQQVDVAMLKMAVWGRLTGLTQYERVSGCSEKPDCGTGETILRRLTSGWIIDQVFPHSRYLCGVNLKDSDTGVMLHVMTVQMNGSIRMNVALDWVTHMLQIKRAFPTIPIIVVYKEAIGMRRDKEGRNVEKVIREAFGLRFCVRDAKGPTKIFTMDIRAEPTTVRLDPASPIFDVIVRKIPPLKLGPTVEENFSKELRKAIINNWKGKPYNVTDFHDLASICETSLDEKNMSSRYGEPGKGSDPGLGDWFRPQLTGPPTTLFSSYNRAPYCTQRTQSCLEPVKAPEAPEVVPQVGPTVAPDEEDVRRPRDPKELQEFLEWKRMVVEKDGLQGKKEPLSEMNVEEMEGVQQKEEPVPEAKVQEEGVVQQESVPEKAVVAPPPTSIQVETEEGDGDDSNDEETGQDSNAVRKTIILGVVGGDMPRTKEEHMADLGVTLWATRYNDIDRNCSFRYYQRLTGCCVASSTQATAVCIASKSCWKVREAFMHNYLLTGVNVIDKTTNLMFHFIVFHMTLDQIKVTELMTQLAKHLLQIKRFYPGVTIALVGWIDGYGMVPQQTHRLFVVEHLFNLKRQFERKDDVARYMIIWTMSKTPASLCVQLEEKYKLQMLLDVTPPDDANPLRAGDEKKILEDLTSGLSMETLDVVKMFKTFKDYAEKAPPLTDPKSRQPAVLRFGFLHPSKNKEDGKRSFVFLVNEGSWYRPKPFKRLTGNPRSRWSASEALERKKEGAKLVGVCPPMANTENRDRKFSRRQDRNDFPGGRPGNRNFPGPVGHMNDNRNFPGPQGPMIDNRNFPGPHSPFPGNMNHGPMTGDRNIPGNFAGPHLAYHGPGPDYWNHPGPGNFPANFPGAPYGNMNFPCEGPAAALFLSRDPIPFPNPGRNQRSPSPIPDPTPDPAFVEVWNQGVEPEVKRSDSPGLGFLPKSIVGDNPNDIDWKNLQDTLTALSETKKTEKVPELLPPPPPPPFMAFGLEMDVNVGQKRSYSTSVADPPSSDSPSARADRDMRVPSSFEDRPHGGYPEQKYQKVSEETGFRREERFGRDRNWSPERRNFGAQREQTGRGQELYDREDAAGPGQRGEHFGRESSRDAMPSRGFPGKLSRSDFSPSTRGGGPKDSWEYGPPKGDLSGLQPPRKDLPPEIRGAEPTHEYGPPRGSRPMEPLVRETPPPTREVYSSEFGPPKFGHPVEHLNRAIPPSRSAEQKDPWDYGLSDVGHPVEHLNRAIPPSRSAEKDPWDYGPSDVGHPGEPRRRDNSPPTRGGPPRAGHHGDQFRRDVPPPFKNEEHADSWKRDSFRRDDREIKYDSPRSVHGVEREGSWTSPSPKGGRPGQLKNQPPRGGFAGNLAVPPPFQDGERNFPTDHRHQRDEDQKSTGRNIEFPGREGSWNPATRGGHIGDQHNRGNPGQSPGFGRGKRSFADGGTRFPAEHPPKDWNKWESQEQRHEGPKDFEPLQKAGRPSESFGQARGGFGRGGANSAGRAGVNAGSPGRGRGMSGSPGRGGFRGRGHEGNRGRGFGNRGRFGPGRGEDRTDGEEPAHMSWSRFKM